MSNSQPSQSDFDDCYRGRQSGLHHLSYLRLQKVFLILQELNRNGLGLEKKRILDYAFGAGTLFHYFPNSASIHGVEIDPQVVDEVRGVLLARGFESVDLQPIEIAHWSDHPLLAQQFDLVVCSHVLEHLKDPVEFLLKIAECLAPDGCLIGLVPINERAVDLHHEQRCEESTIRAWADSAGLQVVTYHEDDAIFYPFQKLFVQNKGPLKVLRRLVGLCIGAAAKLLGPKHWWKLSRTWGSGTGAKPTQAAFILGRKPGSEVDTPIVTKS